MIALVYRILLNLINELRKRDKMRYAFPLITFSQREFNEEHSGSVVEC